mmetsp:Transcript_3980/g.11563  ORF Transcript_3980/g.11563 Transcript_3980/m.11563 type:complete len:399 (+) Transcript_3980:162-1358(+)
MATAPQAAGGDAEPLLSGEDSLLRRVVTGLQPARSWRRWFTSHRDGDDAASAGSATQLAGARDVSRDVETGHGSVVSAADEAAATSATLIASRPAGGDSALVASRSFSSQGQSEITPAPESAPPPAPAAIGSSATDVAGSAAISPAVDAAPERSSGSITSASIVASLGQLLGLGGGGSSGKPDATSDLETGDSDAEKQAQAGRALLRGLSRSGSGSFPMCLICLEPFTEEDFNTGEAMSLGCQCRGEMALRHRACATKWSRVKGDGNCDICKAQVTNLPTPTPRAASPSGSDGDLHMEEFTDPHSGLPIGMEGVPGHADMLFDCIRVTWVFMIICILFFEMNITTALWSGIFAGLGYTLFVRAMIRNQLAAAAAAEMARNSNPSVVHLPPPALHHVLN